MRVTFRASRSLRELAGLHDWDEWDVRSRIEHDVRHWLREGVWWPWRLRRTEAVPFEVAGGKYLAIVGDDSLTVGGRAVIMVFAANERDEQQAARVAAGGVT